MVACRLLLSQHVQWSEGFSRRVLVVVEDGALGDLLVDALADAGHSGSLLPDELELGVALSQDRFDAVIIDLDTRARRGAQLVAMVRELAPSATVIALLPCGGLPRSHATLHYHLAVEKPARLQALLSALTAAHVHPRN